MRSYSSIARRVVAASFAALFLVGSFVADAADQATDGLLMLIEQDVVASARALLTAGKARRALDFLKAHQDSFPDSRVVQLLLGIAYLRSNNPFWAMRTFARRLEQDPNDCEARTWLAWTYIKLATLDQAEELLDENDCAHDAPMATRVVLLRALMAHHQDQKETARSETRRARRQSEATPADRRGIQAMTQLVLPDRLPEVTWRLDLRHGYTSNALLGSPSDPAASNQDPHSTFLHFDPWLRIAPDLGWGVRPVAEIQTKVVRYFAPEVEGLSYFNPTGRFGLMLGEELPRVLVGYRPDYLLLNQGDRFAPGPLWYIGSHRGEVEVEVTSWFLAFGGAGRRNYREMARNRTEVDVGVGGQIPIHGAVSIPWAVTGRKYWSRVDAYDLVGLSSLLSVQARAPGGWLARSGVTVAADWYTESAGFFGPENRNEVFLKLMGAIWSPPYQGLRSGVSYEYSDRDSSIPVFRFVDHRISFRLSFAGVADLGLPSTVAEPSTAEIDWGLGGGSDAPHERIQDLLRQDEQLLQRSCGCQE